MSQLLPHQERVLKEKEELDARIQKLVDFVEDISKFNAVARNEQVNLMRQLTAMRAYSSVLDDRVQEFRA